MSKNRIVDGVFKTDPKKIGFKPNPSYKGNEKKSQSMFDKTRSPQEKKSKTLILNAKGSSSTGKKADSPPHTQSKGWINSPIDSEDSDVEITDPVEKLLEGE